MPLITEGASEKVLQFIMTDDIFLTLQEFKTLKNIYNYIQFGFKKFVLYRAMTLITKQHKFTNVSQTLIKTPKAQPKPNLRY